MWAGLYSELEYCLGWFILGARVLSWLVSPLLGSPSFVDMRAVTLSVMPPCLDPEDTCVLSHRHARVTCLVLTI